MGAVVLLRLLRAAARAFMTELPRRNLLGAHIPLHHLSGFHLILEFIALSLEGFHGGSLSLGDMET